MDQRLGHITILVDDYDKAIHFYTSKLKFRLIEDTEISPSKRWVLVKPEGRGGCSLLLARAANHDQEKFIGNQAGGRVFLFLFTDNLDRDYADLVENGIEIARELRMEEYGKVIVFRDIYGNLWDLIEPSEPDSKN